MENDPAVIVPEDDEVMEEAFAMILEAVVQPSPPTSLSDAIWEGRLLEDIRAIVEERHHPNVLLETPGGRFKQLGYLPLHDAAKARAPLDVIRYLVDRCPEAARVKTTDEHAHLPLHLAILGHRQPEYRDQFLPRSTPGVPRFPQVVAFADAPTDVERCRTIIQAWPQALAEPGGDGRLPIHLLLFGSGDPTEIEAVRALVDPYPGTLSLRDSDGCLPLHYAARHVWVPVDVLQFLAAKHPQALLEPNVEGELPLHVAVRCNRALPLIQALAGPSPESLRVRDKEGNLPLHRAAEEFFAPGDVLPYLVQQNPDAVRARNGEGELPLHVAASSLLVDEAEVLVQEWPESLHELDAKGFPPLRCALEGNDPNLSLATVAMIELLFARSPPKALLIGDRHGQVPLHGVLAIVFPAVEVVQALVRHCPEAVRHKDKAGQLPVHVAASCNAHPFYAQLLAREWPQSLLERDNEGSLPIHVALSNDEPLLFVDALAAPCPRSLLVRDGKGLLPVQVARERVVENQVNPRLSRGGDFGLNVVVRLLDHCPESLRVADADGRVLLHYELDLAAPDLPFVLRIVDAWSGAMCVRDKRGYLPFQLAAARDLPLAVVYFLVRERLDLLLRSSLVGVGGGGLVPGRLSASTAGPPRHGPRAGAGP
jgi:hypothetical protein